MKTKAGVLYVVATPIGNLADISLRALEALKQVDFIAAEDTRHSAQLMQHYGIATPLKSLHEHNEKQRISWITECLDQGKSIALISDAGTPLISDPGFHLVHQLRQEKYQVSPVPGACAAIAALSVSGLSTQHFIFEGFLPAKSQGRKERMQALLHESKTLIFYEAPHRLLDCLQDCVEVFGAREAVVARELTKTYESFYSGTLVEIAEYFMQHQDELRGEVVILIAGAPEQNISELEIERVLKILLKEVPMKTAVQLATEITGGRKNDIYQMALKLKS